MRLLAIETSCDETAAAVLQYDGVSVSVLGEAVSSQIALHAKYGGVVPNLAAREHVRNIVPIVEAAMAQASVQPNDLDCLAVTQGPGLIPALLIGTTAAKTLALAWGLPLLGVNHLEGHIYANFIASDKQQVTSNKCADKDMSPVPCHLSPEFPLLALIVSGGHTQLVLMHDHFQYELLGETEDDAAGEAFDKVAKMLGLPYPGGPEVALRADAWRQETSDKRQVDAHVASHLSPVTFPRPLLNSDDYRFSFSGLKTAVLYYLKQHQSELENENFVATVCHEFQEAVVDTLVGKTERAIQAFQPKTLVIAGGVSANKRLRERIETMIKQYPDCQFRMPEFKYSLDNAVMIGAAGILRYAQMSESERAALKANACTLEPSAHFPLV